MYIRMNSDIYRQRRYLYDREDQAILSQVQRVLRYPFWKLIGGFGRRLHPRFLHTYTIDTHVLSTYLGNCLKVMNIYGNYRIQMIKKPKKTPHGIQPVYNKCHPGHPMYVINKTW